MLFIILAVVFSYLIIIQTLTSLSLNSQSYLSFPVIDYGMFHSIDASLDSKYSMCINLANALEGYSNGIDIYSPEHINAAIQNFKAEMGATNGDTDSLASLCVVPSAPIEVPAPVPPAQDMLSSISHYIVLIRAAAVFVICGCMYHVKQTRARKEKLSQKMKALIKEARASVQRATDDMERSNRFFAENHQFLLLL